MYIAKNIKVKEWQTPQGRGPRELVGESGRPDLKPEEANEAGVGELIPVPDKLKLARPMQGNEKPALNGRNLKVNEVKHEEKI